MRSPRDQRRTTANRRGYTLLELVLVVGLVLVLATLAVPAVVSVFSDHAINQATESVAWLIA
jgi:prepilin-type N-terminal cleavage/methylation domain-containing protein